MNTHRNTIPSTRVYISLGVCLNTVWNTVVHVREHSPILEHLGFRIYIECIAIAQSMCLIIECDLIMNVHRTRPGLIETENTAIEACVRSKNCE